MTSSDSGDVQTMRCDPAVWQHDTVCGPTWQSTCGCGWQGDVKRSQLGEQFLDAERELATHLSAVSRPGTEQQR